MNKPITANTSDAQKNGSSNVYPSRFNESDYDDIDGLRIYSFETLEELYNFAPRSPSPSSSASYKLANPPAKRKRSNRLPSPRKDPKRSKSDRSKGQSLLKHSKTRPCMMEAAVGVISPQSGSAMVTLQTIDQQELDTVTVAAVHASEDVEFRIDNKDERNYANSSTDDEILHCVEAMEPIVLAMATLFVAVEEMEGVRRNSHVLVAENNYIFYRNNPGTYTKRCRKYKTHCRARLHENDEGNFTASGVHNHPVETVEIQKLRFYSECKRRAATIFTRPRQIFDEVRRELFPNLVIGFSNALERAMQRARVANKPPLPQTPAFDSFDESDSSIDSAEEEEVQKRTDRDWIKRFGLRECFVKLHNFVQHLPQM